MNYMVKTKSGVTYIFDGADDIVLDERGIHVEDDNGVITTIYARSIIEIVPTPNVGREILKSASEAVDV